ARKSLDFTNALAALSRVRGQVLVTQAHQPLPAKPDVQLSPHPAFQVPLLAQAPHSLQRLQTHPSQPLRSGTGTLCPFPPSPPKERKRVLRALRRRISHETEAIPKLRCSPGPSLGAPYAFSWSFQVGSAGSFVSDHGLRQRQRRQAS